ncbi:arylamine N-acetyltransferase [Paenibacillus sp. LMG 31456]|uniref:Arylamine N-acetyltransferase n=1 Tax=Paenibacillus foliorum TaxID=2654974 RepID=A0A972K526_9BACL|nr:arylamine N-acetyltransferase [Paenibacillus foliorum]NOU96622.1 arylamine N-acetyltransferase [Paenibacillus foliorum]
MMQLTNEEIKAYLRRLDIDDVSPPTKDYLFELHRSHIQNVPWETVDIVAGRPASIDERQSVRLILDGRSGYCFHLNGAFSSLLASLGYKIFRHRAGVQPLGEQPRVNSFHLGLTVSLENEEGREERWIVDAGLGDMPYEPLPLQAGAYSQGPFAYTVIESEVAEKGWRMVHDPNATIIGVDVAPEIVHDLKTFEPQHEHYSRSADSPWINLFLVRQRHASGSNELRGCVWSKRDFHGIEKTELQSKSQWLEVLGDIFGEHLVNYSRQDREELWKKVRNIHEQWKRTKSSN